MEEESWQVVHVTSGIIKARIIEGRLEAEGIPVRLQYEPIGQIYAITIDGLGEVQILVPGQWLGHARRVLEKEYKEEDLDWEEEPQATPSTGSGWQSRRPQGIKKDDSTT
jgi:hypothetical protein